MDMWQSDVTNFYGNIFPANCVFEDRLQKLPFLKICVRHSLGRHAAVNESVSFSIVGVFASENSPKTPKWLVGFICAIGDSGNEKSIGQTAAKIEPFINGLTWYSRKDMRKLYLVGAIKFSLYLMRDAILLSLYHHSLRTHSILRHNSQQIHTRR